MKNKEFGSDFYFCNNEEFYSDVEFFSKNYILFLSGRSALFSIVDYGIKNENWTKIYIPSYYCKEVLEGLKQLSIEIVEYQFNPFLNNNVSFPDRSDVVVLNVNYFGLFNNVLTDYKRLSVIRDLTHNIKDLLSVKERFVFASLRKELPVPVGGVARVQGVDLKTLRVNKDVRDLCLKKITAMYLKFDYLLNDSVEKQIFRKMYLSAELELERNFKGYEIPMLAKSILKKLNVERILAVKKRNIEYALSLIKNTKLENYVVNDKYNLGLGLVLLFNTKKQRENLRINLIKENIYPAVLWPGQTNRSDIDIQDRMLFIHLDYRYSEKEISEILETVIINLNDVKI